MIENNPNRKLSLTRGWRIFGAVLGIAWEVARLRLILMLGLNMAVVLGTTFQALFMKQVVDALASHRYGEALQWAAGSVGLYVFSLLQGTFTSLVQTDLFDRINHAVDMRMMQAATRPSGLDHMERPEYWDKIEMINQQSWIAFDTVSNLNALLFVGLGLVTNSVLLWRISPFLILAVVAVLPVAAVSLWMNIRFYSRLGDRGAPDARVNWNMFAYATLAPHAKEVRLFGLGPHLLARHKETGDRYVNMWMRGQAPTSIGGVAGGAVYAMVMAGSLYWLATRVIAGAATLGDLAMAVQVLQQLVSRSQQLGDTLAWVAELLYSGQRFVWLMDYQDPLATQSPRPVPDHFDSIRFENVTFRYPGSGKVVLEGLSFEMRAGKTLALVGENGAGKTTIVKLLCRFYDPTEGRILVDGIDLREYGGVEWRHKFAAAFQDFYKFQFTARESVAVGDIRWVADGDRVAAAVTRSGADDLVGTMPNGLETQLGTWFKGFQLSEGQWQRIAIARGAMRESPAILVLDEPTAALDAKAEHKVFELFGEMAHAGVKPPATLLVSHRFSTVRMADHVVVLIDGRVEEEGTHDELMRQGGRYAELFNLQASRYS